MTAVLTTHEIIILAELRKYTYKELAQLLDIKENTLRQITWRTFLKLGVSDLRSAQAVAARRRLIPKAKDIEVKEEVVATASEG
jgi:hypothetical protein